MHATKIDPVEIDTIGIFEVDFDFVKSKHLKLIESEEIGNQWIAIEKKSMEVVSQKIIRRRHEKQHGQGKRRRRADKEKEVSFSASNIF